jgi:hypothetical protein
MEFLRICREQDFGNVVISMKTSNTVLMVNTVRMLVDEMERENFHFPLHLGVTEENDNVVSRRLTVAPPRKGSAVWLQMNESEEMVFVADRRQPSEQEQRQIVAEGSAAVSPRKLGLGTRAGTCRRHRVRHPCQHHRAGLTFV